MRRTISGAISLALLTLAASASAQIVTSPTKIPDSNKDGKVQLVGWAKKVTPAVPSKTTVYGPCNDVAPYKYSIRTPGPVSEPTPPPVVVTPPPVITPPVVTPPVVTPPPVDTPPPVETPPVIIPPVVTPPVVVTPPAPSNALTSYVGDTAFLQISHLSMAISDVGTWGTYVKTPAGFASYKLGEVTNLGLYADLDGFGAGKASPFQDAIAMGAIIERFNIGFAIAGVRTIEGNATFGQSTISGTGSAAAGVARWSGATAKKLKVDQVVSLADDAKFVKVEVTLINQSGAAMTDVRYMRSTDPDQDLSYKNLIKIERQGGKGAGAFISAGTPKGDAPFFYYTAADRARVSAYNMINRYPYKAEAYDTAREADWSTTADSAVNIAFALGSLAPGQSTTLVFYMGLTDDLAVTLKQIKD